MELKNILSILKGFRDIFWVVVVFVLLIIVYFKNTALNNCRSKEPEVKVEYVYKTQIDTIRDTIVEPYEVIKWKEKPVIVEQDGTTVELEDADSMQIVKAYENLYTDYNSTYSFDNILKDDTVAFIRLKENVTKNNIFNRELIFEDRTPVVHLTTKVPERTFSVIAGLDGSIGKDLNTISAGVGFVTKSNSVYLFKYDPINKGYGGAVYIPIFNFKK